MRSDIVCSYASRSRAKADAFCSELGGAGAYSDYAAAIEDPAIDAVVIAVPPRYHLALTLAALAARSTPRSASSSRRKTIGCGPMVSPMPA